MFTYIMWKCIKRRLKKKSRQHQQNYRPDILLSFCFVYIFLLSGSQKLPMNSHMSGFLIYLYNYWNVASNNFQSLFFLPRFFRLRNLQYKTKKNSIELKKKMLFLLLPLCISNCFLFVWTESISIFHWKLNCFVKYYRIW